LEDYLEALRKAEAPKNLGGNESCLWIRRSLLVLIREQLGVKLPGNPDGLRLSAFVCGKLRIFFVPFASFVVENPWLSVLPAERDPW
jgi:hypothetical protein